MDGKPAVTTLDDVKIISAEVAKGGAKSLVAAAGISAAIELGSDFKNGRKIDAKRLKDIGKNSAKAGVHAAADTTAKVVSIKVVEQVGMKIIGKTASKAATKNIGKIAGPAGGFIVDSVVSVKGFIQGTQSGEKTAIDIGLNGVNAILYTTFPPAAITMTASRILWDVCKK